MESGWEMAEKLAQA
jgi:hypothetical protein